MNARRTGAIALALVSGLMASCGAGRGGEAGQAVSRSFDGSGDLSVTLVREAPDQPTVMTADARGVVVFGRRGAAISYAADGREQWRIDPGVDAGSRVDPVALDADFVVVPVFDLPTGSGVLALERSTGRTRWEAPVAEPKAVAIGAMADGSKVVGVVERSGIVTVLQADDGAIITQITLGFGRLIGAPHLWIRDGRIVVAWAQRDAAEIRVLDGRTGEIQWAWSAPGLGAAPALDLDRLIVVENTVVEREVVRAEIRALDLATGAVLWSRPVRGGFLPTISVAISGGRAVVVDLDGRFTAVDARTGELVWHRRTRLVQLEAEPLLTPAVAAVTTYGTGLVAVSARTGAPIRNDNPGPVQTVVTIEDSTAAAGSLLLLVRHRAGEGEIWWLRPS